jgi:hypothetical protein
MASRTQPIGGHPEGIGATVRTDRWWVESITTVAVLGLFGLYATWAALQGRHYSAAPYLSPFYSPVLFTDQSVPGSVPAWHALFGNWPTWWPQGVPTSPAFFILFAPGLFRFTCYYYRKAYYRAFTGSPPACAVVPFAKSRAYKGETGWLLFQNLHRYALYLAIPFLPILLADAVASFINGGRLGVGVGSIILVINVAGLSGYLLGCHSVRHLIGGREDCMSCGFTTTRHKRWKLVSWLNERHGRIAWFSLVWVGLTDLYVRLVSMGVVRDLNTWGG